MKNTLVNKNMDVEISEERGNLDRLSIKRKGFGKWTGCPGRLTIVDELRRRTYTDTKDPMTCSQKRRRRNGETVIENRKEFKGADFSVKETWRMKKDALSWDVTVSLNKGSRDRTIQVRQLVPYPKPAYGLGVWSAQSQFPTTIERVGGLHLAYGDACFGTVIPAVTLYKEKEDVGLTIAKPFGSRTAQLAFSFQGYHSAGVDMETTLLGLRKGKPATTGFLIHAHSGCWRSGLRWLYKKYPEYFNPPNTRIREIEGGFLMANPFSEEETIAELARLGVKWEELHNHFPFYGEYAPNAPEWESVVAHDYPEAPGWPGKVSAQAVEDHIRMVHRHGIKCLMYFQCAGDAFIPHAEENFPDAIARGIDGARMPSWKECCLMNADPSTSFGKEMLRMIDRFLKRFPDIDGVFLDQLCYTAVDAAHDDGVTLYENAPAYDLGHCYEKPVKKLTRRIHEQGKLVFANGPFNVEVQKDVDGVMAEGCSWIGDVMKWLCIAKPLLIHTYADDPRKVETMFRQCLLCGGSYSVGGSSTLVKPPPLTPKARKVFQAYIPLVEKLCGRKWLLEPDPIELPFGCDGNIFEGENKTRIITLVAGRRSVLEKKGVETDVTLKARFKGMSKYRKAESFGTHYGGSRPVRVAEVNGLLKLTLPEHAAASVIVLSR